MTRLGDLAELLVLGFGLVGAGVLCLALPRLLPSAFATPPRRVSPRGRAVPVRRHRRRVRPGAVTVAELSHRLALATLAREAR